MSFLTDKKIGGYLGVFSCAAILAGARPATASIDYGMFVGTTVTYSDVVESNVSLPASNAALYGAPIISGNSLIFNPPAFAASSANGLGAELTNGHLQTPIVSGGSLGSSPLSALEINEAGDYTLAGTGTANTSVSVSGNVILTIADLTTGLPVNGPFQVTANGSLTFTPDNGTYSLPGNAGSGQWSGSVFVNLDAAVAAAGYTGSATQVFFNLDNILTAFSQPGTIDQIEKKSSNGVIITVLPEPASMGLLAVGGISLLARRRRA